MLTAEINTQNLLYNAAVLKSKTAAAFIAVVKSDAYGHGIQAAKSLEFYADAFAVATPEEAEELNGIGISKKIIILGNIIPDKKLSANIIPTVTDKEQVFAMRGRASKINIKVNTGMNRIGARPEEIEEIISAAKGRVGIESVFTHFYDGKKPSECIKQFVLFNKSTAKFKGLLRHCCSTCFCGLPPYTHLDAVRCGIGLYGYGADGLKPVMSVYTDILQVIKVKRGEHIGYGSFTAESDCEIAAIRIGYGDGFRRRGGERYVAVGGFRRPVLGQICMDMAMVDVTGLKVLRGGRVYILGGGITMDDLCAQLGTIPYEILTMFKGRVKRKYV